MVLIERSSSGRPSIDIGMPPRPIALTVACPSFLVRISSPGTGSAARRDRQVRAYLAARRPTYPGIPAQTICAGQSGQIGSAFRAGRARGPGRPESVTARMRCLGLLADDLGD